MQRTFASIARSPSSSCLTSWAITPTPWIAFAVRRGLRPDNPAHGVEKPPVRKMQRFLSEQEITRLAAALDAETSASGNPFPVAAIKLLLFTGCRRSEIMELRWEHVDFERGREGLRLPDSKTGEKTVHLNAPALAVLDKLPRIIRASSIATSSRRMYSSPLADTLRFSTSGWRERWAPEHAPLPVRMSPRRRPANSGRSQEALWAP